MYKIHNRFRAQKWKRATQHFTIKKKKIVAALNKKNQQNELGNSNYKVSMQQDFPENNRKHLII